MDALKNILILSFFSLPVLAQKNIAGAYDKNKKLISAEAACGECKLGLKGTSCDLAVRINGVAYFVDGVNIDSLGNAHAKNGFCNAIRKAEVQGEIKNDRFLATYLHVFPTSKKLKVKKHS